jgi:hypothetical protein
MASKKALDYTLQGEARVVFAAFTRIDRKDEDTTLAEFVSRG